MQTPQDIDLKIKQLKERKKRLISQESARQRKAEARAKIILGGAFIALDKKGLFNLSGLLPQLKSGMRERDKKALDDWLNRNNEE